MGKSNRGKKQRERRKFTENQPPQPKQVITIQQSFQKTEDMIALGPFLHAEWALPPELQARRTRRGLPPLGAIAGPMILDTGAEMSLISSAVVEALGLETSSNLVSPDPDDTHGPGLYLAELGMYMEQGKQRKRVGFSRQVMLTPGLEQNISEPGSSQPSPGPIGVLGRDFLQHAVMIYDGPKNTFILEILSNSLAKDS